MQISTNKQYMFHIPGDIDSVNHSTLMTKHAFIISHTAVMPT